MEILNFLYGNIYTIICLFSRFTGLFVFMPVVSSDSIPKKIKVPLALILSYAISMNINYPKIESLYEVLIYVVMEFLVGLLIGFISNLFMESIFVAGAITDYQLGIGMMSHASGVSNSENVSFKIIEYLALLLFVALNQHLYLIYVISQDINVMNLYSIFLNGNIGELIIEILTFVFVNGLNLAMPFVLLFLLIDLSMGIMNKSVPSFNSFLFSIPIKMIAYLVCMIYYSYSFTLKFGNGMIFNNDILVKFYGILVK